MQAEEEEILALEVAEPQLPTILMSTIEDEDMIATSTEQLSIPFLSVYEITLIHENGIITGGSTNRIADPFTGASDRKGAAKPIRRYTPPREAPDLEHLQGKGKTRAYVFSKKFSSNRGESGRIATVQLKMKQGILWNEKYYPLWTEKGLLGVPSDKNSA